MADLQKTIKGLRCHSEPKFGPDEYFCETCPYDEATCGLDVPNDALSLLKAQEPRVMTLDEVLAHDYKDGPLWLETIDNVITCGFAYCYKYYVQFSIPVMENEYLLKRDTWNRTDTYNKIWRCWTSRPTDEQREATPWE
ncbi:MAG: hypothetical protein IJP78_07705 [Clostridia bacterium]|nr:hypothetical protein [Clostridia bacterium]